MTTYQTATDPTGVSHSTALGDSSPMCDADLELTNWSDPAYAWETPRPSCPECLAALVADSKACVVCETPLALSPDGEAGHAQGAIQWMPVCSDACTAEFYAQGGGMLESSNG